MSNLKVGDTVRINIFSDFYLNNDDYNPINEEGKIVVIDKARNDFQIGVTWENGLYNTYNYEDLELVKQNKTTNIMQLMKDAVEKAANRLLQANNTVTTLEIKTELRKSDPHFRWKQNTDGTVPGVSELMNELHNEGKFLYYDNGTYRVYNDPNKVASVGALMAAGNTSVSQGPVATGIAKVSAPVVTHSALGAPVKTVKAKPKVLDTTGAKKISMKKALDLIQGTKGRFFTVLFLKQDGTERIMNAQYLKDQANQALGYIKVKEAAKLKTNPADAIRQVNIQTLKYLKVGGETYKVRN